MSEDLFSLARNENKSFSPSTASSLARTASPSDATRVFIHFLSLVLARAAVLARQCAWSSGVRDTWWLRHAFKINDAFARVASRRA